MKKKTIKVTRWKLEDDLTTDESMVLFLDAAMNENDPEYFATALQDVIDICMKRLKTKNKAEAYKVQKEAGKLDIPTLVQYFNLYKKAIILKIA